MNSTHPHTVDNYIKNCPKQFHNSLQSVRTAIKKIAPKAEERMDYFEMPGYSYDGYDYDGMFAWFSYKKPYIRLHIRPPVLENFKKEVHAYKTTKSIISFSGDEKIPLLLIQKLVKASIAVMKQKKLVTKK